MAKWGSAKWGAFKWGDIPTPISTDTKTVWIVQVNWSGTWINEAPRVRELSIRRGSQYLISPDGTQFNKIQSGEVNITFENTYVDNSDPSKGRRYNPYNTNSPIYSGIRPGKTIRIIAKERATQTARVLFTGKIADIRPVEDNDHYATLRAVDGITFLQQQEKITVNAKEFITVSDAIIEVLKAAGWSGGWNIQPSACKIQIFDPAEVNAMTTIDLLCQAGLGRFFIDKNGQACYYDLSYDGMTVHSIDQAVCKRLITVAVPWDNVRNSVSVWANRRGVRPMAPIYQRFSADKLDPASGQGAGIRSVEDDVTYENSRDVRILPGGYKANVMPNNTGQYITNYFAVTLSNVTSTKAHIKIVNNGPITGYLTSLTISGRKYAKDHRESTASDSTSIADFEKRTFTMDSEWLQDFGFAKAYTTIILAALKDPSFEPTITIQGRPDIQYAYDLFDKVAFTSSTLGIDVTYRIGQIEIKWLNENGEDTETKLYLQRYIYNNPAVSPIDPDPYYPGVEVFPERPIGNDPGGGGISNPPILPAGNCSNNPDAPANGPYTATPDIYQIGPDETATFNYPCAIRSLAATNPTRVEISADFEYGTTLSNFEFVALLSGGGELSPSSYDLHEYSYSINDKVPVDAYFAPAQGSDISGFRLKNTFQMPIIGSDVIWANPTTAKQTTWTYPDTAWKTFSIGDEWKVLANNTLVGVAYVIDQTIVNTDGGIIYTEGTFTGVNANWKGPYGNVPKYSYLIIQDGLDAQDYLDGASILTANFATYTYLGYGKPTGGAPMINATAGNVYADQGTQYGYCSSAVITAYPVYKGAPPTSGTNLTVNGIAIYNICAQGS